MFRLAQRTYQPARAWPHACHLVQFHDDAVDDGVFFFVVVITFFFVVFFVVVFLFVLFVFLKALHFAAPVFLGLSAALATLSFTESDPIIWSRVPPLVAVIALAVRRNKGAMKRRDAAAAEWRPHWRRCTRQCQTLASIL